MKTDQTRDMVKQSIVHTSDQFTDKLMKQVVMEKNIKRDLSKAFIVGCSGCGVIAILVAIFHYAPTFDTSPIHIAMPPLVVKLSISMILLFMVSKLITLKENFRRVTEAE